MYEPQREEERVGCWDAVVLTRAIFGILLPPLAAIFLLFGCVGAFFVLLAIHPALGLIPIGVLAAGIAVFLRWERRRLGSHEE